MAGNASDTIVMDRAAIAVFLETEFPQVRARGDDFSVEAVSEAGVLMRLTFHENQIRPGGPLSGPTMMTLADLAMYACVLSRIGPVALAVTTALSINFLRKPEPADLLGDCRLLKLGRSLAVGEVTIRSDGAEAPCAHAVLTYSIPPERR